MICSYILITDWLWCSSIELVNYRLLLLFLYVAAFYAMVYRMCSLLLLMSVVQLLFHSTVQFDSPPDTWRPLIRLASIGLCPQGHLLSASSYTFHFWWRSRLEFWICRAFHDLSLLVAAKWLGKRPVATSSFFVLLPPLQRARHTYFYVLSSSSLSRPRLLGAHSSHRQELYALKKEATSSQIESWSPMMH